jgi:hypothetical protein
MTAGIIQLEPRAIKHMQINEETVVYNLVCNKLSNIINSIWNSRFFKFLNDV